MKTILTLILQGFLFFSASAQVGVWKSFNSFNSGIPNGQVLGIAFDKQGNTWCGTLQNGLAKLAPDLTTWTVYTTANSLLPSNSIRSIAVDKKGVIWVATALGVVRISNGVWTVFNTTINQAPLDNQILNVAVDSLNRKWFCIQYGGIASFNDTTWSYTAGNSTPPHVQFSWRNAFHPNGTRYMCLTSTTSGLWYKPGTAAWAAFNASNSILPSEEVRWIDIDKQGIVWVATGNGLSRLQGSTFTNLAVGGSSTFSQVAISVKSDRYGALWAGTYSSTNSTFKFENGTWTQLTNVVGNSSLTSVETIAEDSKGRVWFGSENGLFMYERVTGVDATRSGEKDFTVSTLDKGIFILQHPEGNYDLQCYDLQGRRLKTSVEKTAKSTTISGAWASGIVHLVIRMEDGTQITKRILN